MEKKAQANLLAASAEVTQMSPTPHALAWTVKKTLHHRSLINNKTQHHKKTSLPR